MQTRSGRVEEDAVWLRKLLEAGRLLTSQIERNNVPLRVLDLGRELTGARYAALGVLNAQRTGLERFEFAGVDEPTRRAIGDLPQGRGVLGVLIEHPEPLRLADVASHPSSFGFPAGHPVMRSFLGVPISIAGQAWGNLYLAEKSTGQFTSQDEEAAVILAGWAAIAIENSRLYETSETRRIASEQMGRALEAARDVTLAIASDLDLDRVLGLIAERARALLGASRVMIWLPDGDEIEVVAHAGELVGSAPGTRIPLAGTVIGTALDTRSALRLADLDLDREGARGRAPDAADADNAMVVPMLLRGSALGVLAAVNDPAQGPGFTQDDERLLWTFAASASSAVELARSVASDRLRVALAAAEGERMRWARELHDETLQGMAGVRMRLSFALRSGEVHKRLHGALTGAIEDIEHQITSLRGIIAELRPAALDELGLRAAIESMLDRHRESRAPEIEHDLAMLTPATRGWRLHPELETTAYRLTQEAVNNAIKHARAGRIAVNLHESATRLMIRVRDDGAGFDPNASHAGLGLTGMHERVKLAGGTLQVDSIPGVGTEITAHLPITQR